MVTLALFVVSLALYIRTLAPTITWRNNGADSGDLVAAIFSGGVPHPPGYPFYTSLGRLFVTLPAGDVAYRVNLLSAVAAAVTVVVVYATINRILAAGLPLNRWVAAAAALLFSTGPMFWSQATIAEVYALNALLTALVLFGLLLWAQSGDPIRQRRGMWLVAIALGLGLAHHLTMLFLVPAAFVLLRGRTSWSAVLKMALVAVGIGVLFYLSLMPRAWSDPPVNWGDPGTMQNLWGVVSGQIYRGYVFGLPWSDYPLRLAAWAKLLFDQFGPLGVALGLYGALHLGDRSQRVALALAFVFVTYSVFAIGYNSVDSDVYLIPAYLAFTLYIAEGFAALLGALAGRIPSRWPRLTFPILVVLGLSVLPVANVLFNFSALDLSRDTRALDYARDAFASMPDDAAVVSSDTGEHIFALWYYRHVVRPDSHVLIVVPGLLAFPWYNQELQRHNPGWLWPSMPGRDWYAFLQDLIARNRERYPIFWAERDSVFEKIYTFTPAGPIYRVTPR